MTQEEFKELKVDDVILLTFRICDVSQYSVDIEEMFNEEGTSKDHSYIQRCATKFYDSIFRFDKHPMVMEMQKEIDRLRKRLEELGECQQKELNEFVEGFEPELAKGN